MAAVGTRSFTQIHPACAAKKVESPPADFHAGPGMNAGTFQMDRIGKNKIVEHHHGDYEQAGRPALQRMHAKYCKIT